MIPQDSLKLKVGQVKIGDKIARVYFDEQSGKYSYSLRSLASLIGIHSLRVSDFINSGGAENLMQQVFQPHKNHKNQCESLEPLRCNGFEAPATSFSSHFVRFTQVKSGSKISAVSCELSSVVINHFALQGCVEAQKLVFTLMNESLQLRAMRAFGADTQDAVHGVQDTNNEQLATKHRKEARSRHMSWQNACKHLGLNPRVAHEKITLAVWGMTASEARKLPLTGHADEIWADKSVGINHHPNAEKMRVYYLLKDRIVSYRAGDLTERLNRAIKELEISPVK